MISKEEALNNTKELDRRIHVISLGRSKAYYDECRQLLREIKEYIERIEDDK